MPTKFQQAMDLLGLNHEDRGLHLISVEMEGGRIHAKFAKVQSVTSLNTYSPPDPEPEYRTSTDPDAVKPGLYRVYWKSGGSSPAAVGHDHAGRLWLAPTNWILTAEGSFAHNFDWSGVDYAVRIDPGT